MRPACEPDPDIQHAAYRLRSWWRGVAAKLGPVRERGRRALPRRLPAIGTLDAELFDRNAMQKIQAAMDREDGRA